jgi:hypothetical protein
MLKPLLRAALLLGAALLTPAACTQNGSSGASTSSGGTSGGNGFDAGVTTNSCVRDQDCGAGLVCGTAGTCVAGAPCASTANCGECEAGGSLSCGFTGAAYCDTAAGTCRRPNSSCEPCTADEQCGTNEQLGLTNRCLDYGDGKFCGLACNGGCSPGFECKRGTGACPANAMDCACRLAEAVAPSCAGAPSCTADSQCPTGQHCTTDLSSPPRRGVCLPFCLYDEECPTGKICRTEPGPAYGTCTQACTPGTTGANNTICQAWGRFGARCPATACPAGFECTAAGWCDVPGCQTDTECLLARTICNTATMSCEPGCRTVDDCGAFEVCTNNQCAPQGCRGKNLSCNIGQFCCGKELYDPANGGQACPTPVTTGACFNAADPFCRRCEDDNGCMDITSFGVESHCYDLQRGDADGGTQSVGKFCSVGCRTNDDCPRGVSCQDLPGPNDTMVKGCLDAVCAALNPAP